MVRAQTYNPVAGRLHFPCMERIYAGRGRTWHNEMPDIMWIPARLDIPFTDFEVLLHQVRARFDSGATRSLAWRRRQLDALLRLLEENGDAIAQALDADLAKPPHEVILGETTLVRAEIRHARSRLERWSRPRPVPTPPVAWPADSHVRPEPLGVVLIIGAWNYPVQLTLAPLVAAIAAGNCAVIKPSEVAPETSALLARLVPEYLDTAAVKVVEGGVPETTELLALRFDHVFYTGSGRVGRIVMRACAEHLTPVTLELGGKSPAVVDATADLASAARRIAWGKALNAGQTCIAPDYVLVDAGRRDALVQAIAANWREMYGEIPLASPDYARIVNADHFRRLTESLDGLAPAIGGQSDANRLRIAPTIVIEPPEDHVLMHEEIFGPILPVLGVSGLEDAIDRIAAGDAPLSAYLFTRSRSNRRRFLEAVRCGNVCVNDVMMFMSAPELPFGGVGASGTGRYHGKAGFDRLSHLKAVMKRGRRPENPVRFAPYAAWKTRLLKWLG